jgi:hypothetical protein
MKSALTISIVLLVAAASSAQAQSRIWRCGNTYTNDGQAEAHGCKLVEGGNVTVVAGHQGQWRRQTHARARRFRFVDGAAPRGRLRRTEGA